MPFAKIFSKLVRACWNYSLPKLAHFTETQCSNYRSISVLCYSLFYHMGFPCLKHQWLTSFIPFCLGDDGILYEAWQRRGLALSLGLMHNIPWICGAYSASRCAFWWVRERGATGREENWEVLCSTILHGPAKPWMPHCSVSLSKIRRAWPCHPVWTA